VRNLTASIKLKPTCEQIEETEMTTRKPIYTIALATILTAALCGCAAFRPGEARLGTADANITADVEGQLNQLPNLGPPGSIAVQTVDHVVYLNGIVDGGLQKRIAESVAMQASGVTNVVNNIAVSHT
jgi:osmotically-inducible protein OsmY